MTNKAQAPSALWLRYLFCLRGKVKVTLYRVSRAVLLKTYQSLRYKSCETVHCTCKRQQYTSGQWLWPYWLCSRIKKLLKLLSLLT